ncbi:MAG: hypothetical protein LBR61_12615 [Synergistaceae bacterium]|jgi:hypothetical protein|nr:hypothetical protein [Synergistaceae bacterium]
MNRLQRQLRNNGWLVFVLMFVMVFVAAAGGCGGGSDSDADVDDGTSQDPSTPEIPGSGIDSIYHTWVVDSSSFSSSFSLDGRAHSLRLSSGSFTLRRADSVSTKDVSAGAIVAPAQALLDMDFIWYVDEDPFTCTVRDYPIEIQYVDKDSYTFTWESAGDGLSITWAMVVTPQADETLKTDLGIYGSWYGQVAAGNGSGISVRKSVER